MFSFRLFFLSNALRIVHISYFEYTYAGMDIHTNKRTYAREKCSHSQIYGVEWWVYSIRRTWTWKQLPASRLRWSFDHYLTIHSGFSFAWSAASRRSVFSSIEFIWPCVTHWKWNTLSCVSSKYLVRFIRKMCLLTSCWKSWSLSQIILKSD